MDPQTDPQPSQEPGTLPGPASGAATAAEPTARTGFLADTVDELRKVVWPSRQQLFGESVAVILMVTLSAFAIAAIDRFYSWANSQVFR